MLNHLISEYSKSLLNAGLIQKLENRVLSKIWSLSSWNLHSLLDKNGIQINIDIVSDSTIMGKDVARESLKSDFIYMYLCVNLLENVVLEYRVTWNKNESLGNKQVQCL